MYDDFKLSFLSQKNRDYFRKIWLNFIEGKFQLLNKCNKVYRLILSINFISFN